MYVGTYEQRVDAGGRLAIPSRLRRGAETLVIHRGVDRNLTIQTVESFDRIVERVNEATATQSDRSYARMLFSDCSEEKLDRQGRITIPWNLRPWAGLRPGSDIVIIGVMRVIEVWDRALWQEYQAAAEKQFADLLGDNEFPSELHGPERTKLQVTDADGLAHTLWVSAGVADSAAAEGRVVLQTDKRGTGEVAAVPSELDIEPSVTT